MTCKNAIATRRTETTLNIAYDEQILKLNCEAKTSVVDLSSTKSTVSDTKTMPQNFLFTARILASTHYEC